MHPVYRSGPLPDTRPTVNRRTFLVSVPAAVLCRAAATHAATPTAAGGLLDHHGRTFQAARLAGRWTLLTFGFTQCGSTCPISMMAASQMLAAWPDAEPPGVVLVTLDPLTDTPVQLATYLRRFDARMLGVTGPHAAIERMSELFRVGRRRAEGGTLEHSSIWYLLDPDVRVRATFPHDTPPAQLVRRIMEIRKYVPKKI